jgi:group I intron endonuclease
MVAGRIYLVTNMVNGKYYVGQTTKEIKERWMNHLYQSRAGLQYALHAAIREYGEQAFLVEELVQAESTNRLNLLQTAWIIATKSYTQPLGYNQTLGGKRHEQTEGSRRKISAALKGRVFTDAHRAKLSAANRGRHLSDEWRAKLAESHTGKRLPPFTAAHRLHISNAAKGRKLTAEGLESLRESRRRPEFRAKISAARSGKPLSEEHRAAISAANKGREVTLEHREALSKALSKAWQEGPCRAAPRNSKGRFCAPPEDVIS